MKSICGKTVTREPAGSAVHPVVPELRGACFRMILPGGWTDRSIYCAGGPVVDGFQTTLTVTQERAPTPCDLAAFVDDQLRQLAGQLDEYRLIESRKTLLGARPCFRARFSWREPNGKDVSQCQWFVHRGAVVFVITATTLDEAFSALEPELESIVSGFTPLSA